MPRGGGITLGLTTLGGLEKVVSAEPIRKEATGRYLVVVDVAAPGEKRQQLKRRFTT